MGRGSSTGGKLVGGNRRDRWRGIHIVKGDAKAKAKENVEKELEKRAGKE